MYQNKKSMQTYKLTQYSHGAGCGCKISPAVLDKILTTNNVTKPIFKNLLVGNEERDDAAVFDLGDGTAIVSTTDFFMPIVDDAFTFGKIASVNAISDIYAMGGTPLLAIAILGFPIHLLPPEVANQIIEGSRAACLEAGIPLAGGHSIDCPEPIFGLAVTGKLDIKNLKKNGGATETCALFLTKPLGVGILTTAQKKEKLRSEHALLAINSMLKLNKIGEIYGTLNYVKAMTDVTGFGLLGHLSEMCEASNLAAIIDFGQINLLEEAAIKHYLNEKCVPGGTTRNWESYGNKISELTDYQRNILADPQTSGGLLVAVEESGVEDFLAISQKEGYDLKKIGYFEKMKEDNILVRILN